MYSALTVSSNVCAVRLIKEVGIKAVIQMARTLGLTTPLEYDYTIALGSNGTKLFEVTRAYGAFANGGYVVQPFAIERIETSRGKVVYRAPKAKASRQISLKTAAEMTAMLSTVIKHGTGRGADLGIPSAGKTGTTDNYKDASFIGYTPTLVTGVWVGNDDNTTTHSVQGGSVPARIWKDVMSEAIKEFGKPDFNYPEIELKPTWAINSYSGENSTKTDENSDNNETVNEEKSNGEMPSGATSIDIPAPVNKEVIKPKPAPAAAPTPTAAPTPVAPIPMATPESVR
jgi:penicillin-binding protein 1A